jgi:hypothetical protein
VQVADAHRHRGSLGDVAQVFSAAVAEIDTVMQLPGESVRAEVTEAILASCDAARLSQRLRQLCKAQVRPYELASLLQLASPRDRELRVHAAAVADAMRAYRDAPAPAALHNAAGLDDMAG